MYGRGNRECYRQIVFMFEVHNQSIFHLIIMTLLPNFALCEIEIR